MMTRETKRRGSIPNKRNGPPKNRYSHMYNDSQYPRDIVNTHNRGTTISMCTHRHTDGQTNGWTKQNRERERKKESHKSQKLPNFYTYPIRCSILYGKFYSDYTHWSAHRNNTYTHGHGHTQPSTFAYTRRWIHKHARTHTVALIPILDSVCFFHSFSSSFQGIVTYLEELTVLVYVCVCVAMNKH